MKDFFSKYSREARVYPTIIGLIPFFILQYYYLSNFLPYAIFTLKVVGNISVSIAVLYLISEFFVRFPSKLLEDRLFEKKRIFPTAQFLLFNNEEYSKELKERLRVKVSNDFSINLLNENEESCDENEARKRIKEAIGLIINRVGNGNLVLKHNISYGFFRNLWGASWIGVLLSVTLIVVSFYSLKISFYISGILFLSFLIYLIFGKFVIQYFGEAYARKLIEEYMSENKNNEK